MEKDEFVRIVAESTQSHPMWFELPPDALADAEQIRQAEHALHVLFPDDYSFFLSKFGGGDFAFGRVYSVDAESELNVVKQNQESESLKLGLLAVSDNGVGDLYGYLLNGSEVTDTFVMWDHEDKNIKEGAYSDLFHFLSVNALRRNVE